ncbi:hypothetical protein GQ457_07G036020 [Hibiscus cannabinus]
MEAIPSTCVTAMGEDSSFEFVGCLTLTESQAQIIKASSTARIIEQTVLNSVNGAGLMTKQYLKLAKLFTWHEDPDVVWFLKFLRSTTGQQAQYVEQQKAELHRKAEQESGETPMVMDSQVDGSFVIVGQPSSAEDLDQFIEASAWIIEQGFDAAMFTTNATSGAGLNTKQYLKLAKQFARHNYRLPLNQGWTLEAANGMLRKVRDGQLVQEVAVINKQMQMADFAAARNGLLRKFYSMIAVLRAQLASVELDKAKDDLPASFKELQNL